jgi:integrase
MKYLQKKVNVRQLDGSYKRKTIYGRNPKELKQKIDTVIEDAESAYQISLKPTFGTVADKWNEHHEKEIAYYTYDCYQAPLKNLKEEFTNTLIEDIKPIDMQRFINEFALLGYAKQTIKLRKIVASLIFDYAILQGYISSNPASVVKIPKNAPTSTRKLPSNKDIEIVKKSVSEPFGLYAYLLYYTGCRREEALALKYEDIDFCNDLISINKVLIFKYGKPVIESRAKSKNGVRFIPLLANLKKQLSKSKSGYIFANENNELLTESQFNIEWRRYKKATGLECTSHQLRHGFATLCYDAGLEDKDASQIFGHSRVELMKDIYVHITETRQEESARKLNEYIKNA